jgi:RsiW-degrading membrane proteinase PrsW (M82 family)
MQKEGITEMFFVLPGLAVIAIYILAAVLPAAFLMRYIYFEDTIEKEPRELLVRLVLLGVAAALVSIFLESLGKNLLSSLLDESSPVYTVLFAFLVVSAVEEGTKFYFLRRRTWNDPNFNYRFDGIVYAVFVSLGFAAFENISYVMGYGLTVAVPRAVLAIPGHMGFAVFMGLFFGRAKLYENKGDMGKRNLNLWAGYLSAVVLHGIYDTCVMLGNVMCAVLFVVYVVAMYIIVIRLVKKESAADSPI